jgi:peptide/nickel transport system permease protein
MQWYIAKRLMLFLPTLIGATMVIFAVARLLPGDIAELKLSGGGEAANIDPEVLQQTRERFGLDEPLARQYIVWVRGLLQLDFGVSMWTEKPVAPEIRRRLPLTFEMATLATTIAILISLPLGTIAALQQDLWVDHVVRVISVIGIAAPTFWTGTIMLYVLLRYFDWSPPLGFTDLTRNYGEHIQQIVWPVLVLGFATSAVNIRMMRSTMLEVMRQDYMRTARAKGLGRMLSVRRHALKNALLPVLTLMGLQFGNLIGGTVILESLFGLPGMGSALLDSVSHRDYVMLQSVVLLYAFLFMTVNLVIDLMYAWLDPRIRFD